jgi:hypothetical protein
MKRDHRRRLRRRESEERNIAAKRLRLQIMKLREFVA